MSKAIQGAAMLGAAVADGAAMFALASTGVGAAALPLLGHLMESLVVGGIAMEAGAVADALIQNRGVGITTRQPAAFRQIVYGTQRIGGVMVYESTTGSHLDQYNYVIVLAGHPVNAILNLYLDGRQVFWDTTSDGYVVRNGVGFGGSASNSDQIGPGGQHYNFGTLVYCEARFGDQPKDDIITGLTANDPNWAASSAGSPWLGGCTYVYLKVEYDTAMFPNPPEIKFDVQGKCDIWDPRTSAYGYTANWALVVADVITDPNFGLNDDTVNQDQLVAAANVCDELVDLANGDQEARYQCHWHYDCGVSPGGVLETAMNAAAGRLSRIGGEWYIWPAYWQGSSASYDESALTGALQWSGYRSFRELVNRVNGTYIAPSSPYNVAGNLYDSNGWWDGTLENQFPYAFTATNYPQYAQDVLHGYSEDANLNADSGVVGEWASGTTYAEGQAVYYGAAAALYLSLAGSNTGNTPGAPALSSDWTLFGGGPTNSNSWSATSTYNTGDVVSYDGALYASAIDSNTGNPPVTAVWWQPWNGIQLPKEVTQQSVLSIAQAQRCAKIILLRNRQQGSTVLPMTLAAWSDLQPVDVLSLSFPALSWSSKQLEVTATTLCVEKDSSGAPRVLFFTSVQETDESVYEWSTTEELTPYDVPAQPANYLPSDLAAPTGLNLTSGAETAVIGADGVVTPRILAAWTEPADARVTQVDVQYQAAGSPSWIDLGLVPVGTTSFYIAGVVAAQTYNVRVASVDASGNMSAWDEVDSFVVVAPNSLQASYTVSPQFPLTQPTSTTIDVEATLVSFGGLAAVGYAARTLTITAPSVATWYYVYIADPTQGGESGSPTLTATATTSTTDVGVQGYTYLGAILCLPDGSATQILAGGWPAPTTFQVGS